MPAAPGHRSSASASQLACRGCLLLLLFPALAPRCSAQDTPFRPESAGSASEPRPLNATVPGSKLSTADQVRAVRESLHCFGNNGSWVYHPEPRPLPWSSAEPDTCDARWVWKHRGRLAGRAADRVTDPRQWDVRPGLKYRWEVEGRCRAGWKEFRREIFCSAVQRLGGPILLAGDSLTKNMFDSLRNNLHQGWAAGGGRSGVFVPRICQHWEKSGRMPGDKVLCEALDVCPFAVFRARNDRLSRLEGLPFQRGNEYFLPWLSLVKTWGIRAVVLNRGAHLAPTGAFKEELEVTLWVLREKHPDLLVLYRATPPGHTDCESIQHPLPAPQNASLLPYGWGSFHEQNLVAKGLVEAYGGLFLDVDHMTSLRADGHRGYAYRKHDCLHYCNPGPLDTWVAFLQNALLQLV